MKKILGLSLCSLITLAASGCATNAANAPDPYEQHNRKVYAFNTKVDHAVIRPIAKGYDKIIPAPVQQGVSNFFANVDTLTTIPNDMLQGKFVYAISDGWRFLINTTAGVGGLFDVATRLKIPQHHEDFGLTFAQWGMTQQPYLVLPILGPSTPRDTVGLVADYFASPWPYIRPFWVSTTILAVKAVNVRTNLLPADQLVDNSFDPYVFVRDAYLQKRQQQINDNKLNYNEFAARYRAQGNDGNTVGKTPTDSIGNSIGTMVVPNSAASASNVTSTRTTANGVAMANNTAVNTTNNVTQQQQPAAQATAQQQSNMPVTTQQPKTQTMPQQSTTKSNY